MPDRLVFHEQAAHELVATLRSIARDHDASIGRVDLSAAGATAALEQFRGAVQRVSAGLDEDLEALADFLSAASTELSRVDHELAASTSTTVKTTKAHAQ